MAGKLTITKEDKVEALKVAKRIIGNVSEAMGENPTDDLAISSLISLSEKLADTLDVDDIQEISGMESIAVYALKVTMEPSSAN